MLCKHMLKGGFKMNTKENLNEEKQVSRFQKIRQFYKENCLIIWALFFVGIISGMLTYNYFRIPDSVYKQEIEVSNPPKEIHYVDEQKFVAQQKEISQKEEFFETAKNLYKEIDTQIAAEQQFLSKRELHDLADLAIESKYWLDKGENLQRKFSPENLTSFLEYDQENFKKLNKELEKLDISNYPEWKVLKKTHESLVRDVEYLNEVSKRILIEE